MRVRVSVGARLVYCVSIITFLLLLKLANWIHLTGVNCSGHLFICNVCSRRSRISMLSSSSAALQEVGKMPDVMYASPSWWGTSRTNERDRMEQLMCIEGLNADVFYSFRLRARPWLRRKRMSGFTVLCDEANSVFYNGHYSTHKNVSWHNEDLKIHIKQNLPNGESYTLEPVIDMANVPLKLCFGQPGQWINENSKIELFNCTAAMQALVTLYVELSQCRRLANWSTSQLIILVSMISLLVAFHTNVFIYYSIRPHVYALCVYSHIYFYVYPRMFLLYQSVFMDVCITVFYM